MSPSESRRGRCVRVAIVDDAPEVLRFMELYLARHDQIEVVGTAGSGPAGLKLVADRSPDVLLLDLDMPGMDGFAVLEELRERGRSGTEVVVVSGLDATEVEARCRELGVRRVFHKGDGFEDLPGFVLEVGTASA